MSLYFSIPQPQRGIIRLGGEERVKFLQGLISNDVRLISPTKGIWAALLTSQGRYLHDFFLVGDGEDFLLDCEGEARFDDLLQRLKRFKLRSKITLEPETGAGTVVAWGADALAKIGLSEPGETKQLDGVVALVDPRNAEMGVRLIGPIDRSVAALKALGFEETSIEQWHFLRMTLVVPESSIDLVPEKSLLLENGFDELNGVAWEKGCYVGQEITARTKYRGLVKKRLVPLKFEGPVPEPGTLVMHDDKEVGEIRSARDGVGLALLRLEALDHWDSLTIGETRASATKPEWIKLDLRPEDRLVKGK